jgi:hypothetical protein
MLLSVAALFGWDSPTQIVAYSVVAGSHRRNSLLDQHPVTLCVCNTLTHF